MTINDYFIIQFEGGLYIVNNEYKKEIKEFLADRTTSLSYLAKRHSIDEISEFLKTDKHIETIMQKTKDRNFLNE